MPGDTGEMPNEGQDTNTQDKGDSDATATDFDFDAWLGEQPEHVKKGFESHNSGLRNALEGERTQRKDFAKQLREAERAAGEGSEAKKALGEMSARAEVAEQRAAFYEEAGKPEIGCSNPKAAFLVASADSLFKRSGEPDWAAIKAAAPELFTSRKAPPGNAGNGSGAPPPPNSDVNSLIRRAAGRNI